MNQEFWQDRSVFITGHTGFKGGWMALWLTKLGAKVYGFSLDAPTNPSFFYETKLESFIERSTIGDINDLPSLINAMINAKPSVVIHMAAKSLVRESYITPIDTFTTNVVGTVNVLEAVRKNKTVQAIVNVTTDKCYENKEWVWPYRESDRLGGYDPYSSSKACAEIVVAAYRKSFFADTTINLASVRAGNVIGGGDWAVDRLIPDFLRAIKAGDTLRIRSPGAFRPWQHVLEPLSGYLLLAEKLVTGGDQFAEAWNFGPNDRDSRKVSWVVDRLCQKMPDARWELEDKSQPHEANFLKLDSTKANTKLKWKPRWNLEKAIDKTVEWHKAWQEQSSMIDISIKQIELYESS